MASNLQLLFAGLGVAAVLYWFYVYTPHTPLPGIPHNEGSSKRLFGDVKNMRNARYRRQWIWSQPGEHNAPLSQAFFFPFRKPVVIVSDYREVVDICARRLKEFDRGDTNRRIIGFTAPNFHFTMASADPQFKAHKELVRDLMAPTFLSEISAPRIYNRAALVVKLWNLKRRKAQGRPFAVEHDAHMATLDIICSVAFGMEDSKTAIGYEISHVEALNPSPGGPDHEPVHFSTTPVDPEIDALLDIPAMMAIAMKSPVPAVSQHLALLKPRHARAWWYRRALMRRHTDQSIAKLGKEGSESRTSALDQLLWREMRAADKADRRADFHSSAIRDEILGFLVGGHDTTAAVFSWWVKYMSTYQDVQHRLRNDLHRAHATALEEKRWPTMPEISTASIPYLDAVMEETLRFAGVGTFIARRATCDTQIFGYHIPKGTDVWLSITGPSMREPALQIPESLRSQSCRDAKQRVPSWGEDLDEFKPERWLKQNDEDGTEWFDPLAGPTLAFSTGPRQCFGKKLAYLELRTLMTLLLWTFEFRELEKGLNGSEIVEKMVNVPRDCYVKLSEV